MIKKLDFLVKNEVENVANIQKIQQDSRLRITLNASQA